MPAEQSYLQHAMTKEGAARVIFADTTAVVQRAITLHRTSRTVAAALGRTLTAAAMMGALLKNDSDSLTLQIKGDGPVGSLVCVTDSHGNVRGYADNPQIELPANAQGKIDVGGAVGKGALYVIRDMGLASPYVGFSPLVSGEIADDITQYFATSEQTPTICALGVRVNRDGSCKSAGGFLLQLLPDAPADLIPLLEANVAAVGSVSALIAEGFTGAEIIGRVCAGLPFTLFEKSGVTYRCNCARERYRRVLVGLGRKELQKMLDEEKPVETVCHFCDRHYIFSLAELREMIGEATKE